MNIKKTLTSITIGLSLAFLPALAGATEAPPQEVSSTEQSDLERLEKIAGQPQSYREMDSPDYQGGFTLYAYQDSGCTLYPSRVHIRKSGAFGTVGAKPYTECNQAVSRISHNSKLYIVEWGGLAYKQMAAATNANTGLPTLTLRSLEWKCKNSNNFLFQQRTTGTVVTAGKTFVTTVQTVKSDLKCGY